MKTFLLSLLLSLNAFALEVPPLTRPIEDLAGVVDSSSKESIESTIRELNKKGIVQISVLVVNSLEGANLEEYSMKVAEKWKLGSKEKNNGVLLLIALNDRKMRFEVGSGIEGDLTDLESSRIIRDMGPYFRKKEFGAGILMAVQKVDQTMEYNSPANKALRAEADRIRAERQAREDEESAKQRAIFMDQAGDVAAGLIGLVGLVLFGMCFRPSKVKEFQSILSKKEALGVGLQQEITKAQKEVANTPVDREKLNYLKEKAQVEDLRQEVQNKKSEIASMKRYLGES